MSSRSDLTVLMPCLNEEQTLEACIHEAKSSFNKLGLDGEVLVADNGSTDSSIEICKRNGVRFISVSEKGYGAALLSGIKSAKSEFIIMGDSDCSYDFSRLGPFVDELRKGADLVVGNRFSGGIEDGAMPFLHRYLGNPVLSFIGRLLFRSRVRDFHCGLRGFRRSSILDLNLVTPGMEFASEMIVKAELALLRVTEVPTVLRRDGRNRPPHLNSWRDGWRHLKFLLLFSPRYLFLLPGLFFIFLGMTIFFLSALKANLAGVILGANAMFFAASFVIFGNGLLIYFQLSSVIAARLRLYPRALSEAKSPLFFQGVGAVVSAIGFLGFCVVTFSWVMGSFSLSDGHAGLMFTVPSFVCLACGLQVFLLGLISDLFNYASPASLD